MEENKNRSRDPKKEMNVLPATEVVKKQGTERGGQKSKAGNRKPEVKRTQK